MHFENEFYISFWKVNTRKYFLKFKSVGGETNDKSFSKIQKWSMAHDYQLKIQKTNLVINSIIAIFQRCICDPKISGMEFIGLLHHNQPRIYVLKVSNRNTRSWSELCSKLTIKTLERVNDVVLVLLTSKIFNILFYSVSLLILNK